MYYPRLKDIREDNDYTQKEIADVLRMTQQQYSLYETGHRDLPALALKELALFYKISSDYILGLKDEK